MPDHALTESPGSTVKIDLAAQPVLSYAMANSDIPVVAQVGLASTASRPGAVLRILIQDERGQVTRPFEQVVDLVANRRVRIDDPKVRLDPAVMLQIDEQRPGLLTAEVEWHGQVLASHAEPIRLLAARQWLRHEAIQFLSLEILAAFVMPNDPAVSRLLNEVTEWLQERTGDASLYGYQADARRVDLTVQAVFEAMQARRISYGEPPASWSESGMGQKVRTPHEVLEGRIGTCLDTTVVMAAVLEQAGIHPLLWVVEGHAFLGYWRHERILDEITQTGAGDLVNRIDLDEIRLVETTALTKPFDPGLYERSTRSPVQSHLSGDLSNVLGVTDVLSARLRKIVPLPASTRGEDGQAQVVVYEPRQHSTAPAPRAEPRRARAHTRSVKPVPPRVQVWKNSLLDLSTRNRLIDLKAEHGVGLNVPTGHLGLVEDALHEGGALHLLPGDRIDQVHLARGGRLPEDHVARIFASNHQLYTTLTHGQYITRLRSLAQKARVIVEETGANNLYLVLGTLVWKHDGKDLRSPLILVPVRLIRRAGDYHLEIDETGTSTPNFCLLEKLYQVHGLRVPGLAEPVLDGAGIDLDAAVRAMRVALSEHGLPFRVDAARADLAILHFAKFRMWKDLDENWEQLSVNPLVHHLIHSPAQPFRDSVEPPKNSIDLDELDAGCPLPGDASQLGAVADAVDGRTFVLEGPPGTGKSQTITNMLTRAVVEGRRVLFVAEKRAALDVVRRRLDEVGMGPFCLDLHDKGSKPVQVRAQINESLNHHVVVDDQDLRAAQQDLRSSRRVLSRYARGLHETNSLGYSFYSSHTELVALGEGPVLPVPRDFLHAPEAPAKVEAVRDLLRVLPDKADVTIPERQHPWGFVLLDDPADLDVERVRQAALAVDESLGHLTDSGYLTDVLAAVCSVAELSDLSAVIRASGVGLRIMDESRGQRWTDACAWWMAELDSFLAAGHPALTLVTPAALDLNLAEIHAHAVEAGESSVIGRSRRLREVGSRLDPVLRPGCEIAVKDVLDLTSALLRLQTEVQGLAQQARSIPGIQVPGDWNPFTEGSQDLVHRQIDWLRDLGRAVDPNVGSASHRVFVDRLRNILQAGESVDAAVVEAIDQTAYTLQALSWECGSTEQILEWWSGDEGLLAGWRDTRAGRALFDPALHSLRRWVAFRQALVPLRSLRLGETYDELLTGVVLADDAAAAFERGLASSSRTERSESNRLDIFDPKAHNRAVERFSVASSTVRRHLRTSLPAQVLARRSFDADTATGDAGELRKEVRRQRGGVGVRALLSKYGELITEIMPCVLVSPDSLARFFESSGQMFDLVVFDEASQIRVADAIGAMGRSKSVVVVGDSKQMPPTTFAQRSFGDEDDDEVVAAEAAAPVDEESILTECVEARVPQKWLSWHYRSTDESLIAFSNLKYYEGRLSSFPTPNTAGPDSGISLIPVDGEYLRSAAGKLKRTNPQEAMAVVAEIRRRFEDSETPPSIGVVTFNAQQRTHIEDLIRDSGHEPMIEALDTR
ncbi:DUF4011 domain-containing protein [Kineosporia babensis]|uniref:DUF4011 domain-containing protein n=1 Tax=Kineosporia babensis TaxID=499548 RepID=A0A9X1SY85_9ACTN|nr:DUF4011 domain-containing protein [Kineosporia babensis]MCD5316614.1 DUF4011 domain-containing protein [Kineosporia babensis]